ncbi:AAEL017342-PA [Aedes aegypti]|uniref:AAEL017342-PA n=1 Tax=Aedes aegypti TaxID=7159 RepID=J9HGQ0_AEDAE|nr:AAEL017342-PA [Aedes aegypti]
MLIFQFSLNYFDTLNIIFFQLFNYYASTNNHVVLFSYDLMFTTMFFFIFQRLLRNSGYHYPLSLQPTLPTEYLMCVLIFSIPTDRRWILQF